jgi:hypothetical protein
LRKEFKEVLKSCGKELKEEKKLINKKEGKMRYNVERVKVLKVNGKVVEELKREVNIYKKIGDDEWGIVLRGRSYVCDKVREFLKGKDMSEYKVVMRIVCKIKWDWGKDVSWKERILDILVDENGLFEVENKKVEVLERKGDIYKIKVGRVEKNERVEYFEIELYEDIRMIDVVKKEKWVDEKVKEFMKYYKEEFKKRMEGKSLKEVNEIMLNREKRLKFENEIVDDLLKKGVDKEIVRKDLEKRRKDLGFKMMMKERFEEERKDN